MASLLPQLWGKGNSRPGAIEHYETLETSFSTENQRGGAQRHKLHCSGTKYPTQLSPPAQSGVPPAGTATVGDEVACAVARMEVSPGCEVFPQQKLSLYHPTPIPGFDPQSDADFIVFTSNSEIPVQSQPVN